jgi:hypothetical protein
MSQNESDAHAVRALRVARSELCGTVWSMNTENRSAVLKVRLRPAEADALRELAEQDDEPVSAVVRRAIRCYIDIETEVSHGTDTEGRSST